MNSRLQLDLYIYIAVCMRFA